MSVLLPIEELFRLVELAGMEVTFKGQPLTDPETRAAAEDAAAIELQNSQHAIGEVMAALDPERDTLRVGDKMLFDVSLIKHLESPTYGADVTVAVSKIARHSNGLVTIYLTQTKTVQITDHYEVGRVPSSFQGGIMGGAVASGTTGAGIGLNQMYGNMTGIGSSSGISVPGGSVASTGLTGISLSGTTI